MNQLSERQEYILSLIVREYVNTPNPVSSKSLVEGYDLDVSSATVRNDMVALEEAGFIASPHTSAGRVPTEAGYRYFVQHVMHQNELESSERASIRYQFRRTSLNVEEWLRLAASVLADTSRSAALVTSPVSTSPQVKHLELISTHGRVVLLILVLDGGNVRQQIITLAEPLEQPRLSQTANRITELCQGLSTAQVRALARRQPALEQEVMELVADLMDQASRRYRVAYYDGLVNILDPHHITEQLRISDPDQRDELRRAMELADAPGARQVLHLLEEQSLLDEVITEALAPEEDGVRVMIAGEGRWEQIDQLSVILSRYGVDGSVTGALGVLGPTRLHYGRAISAVRYVAGLMSSLMIEIYGASEDDDPG